MKIHKAWLILFGCCMLQGGTLGIVQNCRGIYYNPIIKELGFGMGAFSFYNLTFALCACIALPFVSKIFNKFNLRLVLGIASFVFSFCQISFGFLNQLWQFYLVGALQGIASAFVLVYPQPMILGNWFKKYTGLAISISASFSGICGFIGNPLGTYFIENFGWRHGYIYMGLICFLMCFPVSVFLLKLKPEECNLLPYGNDFVAKINITSKNIPAEVAKKSIYFWLIILCCFLSTGTVGYVSYLSPMGIFFGYTPQKAALLASSSMAGSILMKVGLGYIHDKYGLKISYLISLSFTATGLLLLNINSYPIRIIGSFLYGTSMAIGTVVIAITIKDIYGQKSYKDLLPYYSMSTTLGTNVFILIIGYLIDFTGQDIGYNINLYACAFIMLIIAVLIKISVNQERKNHAI